MSLSYVTESRPYDSVYDSTYIGPFHQQASNDSRVAVSSSNMVSGTQRYKYFKRPIMPRMNAVPPQILLAPTATGDPMIPVEIVPEPLVKTVEVQTMYRESEAQTIPYTPEYRLQDGETPDVLLLKNLTYENGLPMGKKEVEMIQLARAKKVLESNLPPFTDEASLALRKRLMENQELKEFKIREMEIDSKREERLATLQRVLEERDESNEFLAAQRVEAIRQTRMDEREKTLQKIRNKRIKVLRKLANRRNNAEPVLHEGRTKDIIDSYFDKGSDVYAPVKRLGKGMKFDEANTDISSRTMPLNNMGNILNLESSIPEKLLDASQSVDFSPEKVGNVLSKSAPGALKGIIPQKGGVTENRLTSAARRDLRNTKRDVEEMHQILQRKKLEATLAAKATTVGTSSAPGSAVGGRRTASTATADAAFDGTATGTADLSKTKKSKNGRPITPDLTVDSSGKRIDDDSTLQTAVTVLQKLIRGRAVQNVMYEGRFRRRELIAELRFADEVNGLKIDESPGDIGQANKARRDDVIRQSTIENVAGNATVNIVYTLASDQNRFNTLLHLQQQAAEAIEIRRKLEAAEGGRRQREGMTYALPDSAATDDVPSSSEP